MKMYGWMEDKKPFIFYFKPILYKIFHRIGYKSLEYILAMIQTLHLKVHKAHTSKWQKIGIFDFNILLLIGQKPIRI